jgi:hypothetical protein
LSDFLDNIFDIFLFAFRKGHGCQTTLLRLLEDWKQALDCNEYIAPYADNLHVKISSGKQSNAFDKSIKIAAIYSLQSKACFQSSKSLKRVV